MTATKGKGKKAKDETPELVEAAVYDNMVKADEFNARLEDTAADLIKGASEVRLRINWFGTSSKVDDAMAAEMMLPTEADRKAVSISKRLMTSKHDAMVALKESRKAIEDLVGGWTVPMIAIKTAVGGEATRKDAGIRLIQKKDMSEFDTKLKTLVEVLGTAVSRLQQAMPEIMAEDQERLKKLYNAEDYPKDLTKLVGVEVTYRPVGVDVDWKTLCPQIYEREQAAAKKKFEAVVESAAEGFAENLIGIVSLVTDRLGNKTRLSPPEKHKMQTIDWGNGTTTVVDLTDAEVFEKTDHEGDPESVPAGHVMLQLNLKGDGTRVSRAWLASPISEKDYHEKLKPYESSEKKRIFASAIDNLTQELESFVRIGNMLGPYAPVISDSVTKVRTMLAQADKGLDSGKITDALRTQSFFRNQFREELSKIKTVLQDGIGDAKNVRRRISTRDLGLGR